MFTFAVTAYQEMSATRLQGQRLLQCIQAAQEHEAITEIVIVDDGSDDYPELVSLLQEERKVRLYRNAENLGVFTNKVEAILRATNPWVITCDSDNVMDAQYLDRAVAVATEPNVWYCPSFAKPHFDYRELLGVYDLDSITEFLTRQISHCAVNTGNQIVHRESFAKVFGKFRGVKRFDLLLENYLGVADREDEKWHQVYGANDSFILVKLWLEAGHCISITSGLEYDHLVHRNNREASNYDRAPIEKCYLSTALVRSISNPRSKL